MASTVPDLSVRHLEAIVTLARSGKFMAASAQLGISQPGLSRIIQQAEGRLGVSLFVRGTRSVTQTEAGQAFVSVAERLLGELDQQTRNLRTLGGQMRGQLVVASLMSISHRLLPAAMVPFRRAHPGLHVQVREGLTSSVQEDIRTGSADIGIGNVQTLPPEIIVEAAADETCYVVLPEGHALLDRPTLSWRALEGEPMISMPSDAGLRRTIDAVAAAQGVRLDHGIVTNQFPSTFDYVAAGLGLAIVPASALSPAVPRAVAVRPLRPALTRRIGIVRRADRPLSPASQAFLEIFRPMFFAATDGRRAGRRR